MNNCLVTLLVLLGHRRRQDNRTNNTLKKAHKENNGIEQINARIAKNFTVRPIKLHEASSSWQAGLIFHKINLALAILMSRFIFSKLDARRKKTSSLSFYLEHNADAFSP